VQVNIWNMLNLNCREGRKDMNDHRSYVHNLSSCENNTWKNYMWICYDYIKLSFDRFIVDEVGNWWVDWELNFRGLSVVRFKFLNFSSAFVRVSVYFFLRYFICFTYFFSLISLLLFSITLLNYYMHHELKLLSLNVRGFRYVNKRRAIFSYWKLKKLPSFVFKKRIQPKMRRNCGQRNGVVQFFSHGSLHSRGVCILVNPCAAFYLRNVQADLEGRFLIAQATDQLSAGVLICLCLCLY